ncbi:glucose-methanol-choline oxidoreductase [Xylaria telfairii]|nr:glucose-methanol-choline oxidoreductase [Xylaria telfairii]
MRSQIRAVCLAAGLVSAAPGNPFSNTFGGRVLGSSFGIPGFDATYDYIVVGGGNAGLTIASRLVEQGAGSVAVVEAGTFYELSNGNHSQIPGFTYDYIGRSVKDWQPLADWGYVTTPQPAAYGAPLHYPRGKMLGGCSARNFMVYHRSTAGAYKKWAEQVGDESYTFDNLLPYFEKSLNFTPPNNQLRAQNATPDFDVSALGTGNGPVSLSFPNWAYAFPTWAVKAFTQIGIRPLVEGFQNGRLLGHAWTMFTIDATTMLRSSSETAFVRFNDPNYSLYPLTLATKVLFDNSKRATGVEVETLGAKYTLSARKEVILSAGAINSPQLLQLSGVGDANLLRSLNIPVVADLPGVGKNMQDHIFFGITRGINAITTSSLGDPAFAAEQNRLFQESATGLLTSSTADLLAWEKLPNKTRAETFSKRTSKILAKEYPADWPELEYIALSGYIGNNSVPSLADPHDGTAYAAIDIVLQTPRSRGSVTITSADATVPPAIDPAYLTDRADIEVCIGAFKRAREFWASSALDGFLVGDEAYPGSDVVTDDDIEAAIRGMFQTIYHGSCTCAMGKPGTPNAVIDTKARVYGVHGLRVVDASSFPFLPPGHPQSIVYALAEKIACDISGSCP